MLKINFKHPILREYKRTKTACKIVVTSNSLKIKGDSFIDTYSSTSDIQMKQLYFINKVKKHFADTLPVIPQERPRPRYFRFSDKIGTFENLREIDLTAAYWNAANNQNFLTPELFKEGMEVDKGTRLVALGALAKKEKHFDFDGENLKHEKTIENFVEKPDGEKVYLKNYFFSVCCYVDQVMTEIFPICFFYWFDAIFILEKDRQQAEKIFNDHLLPFKSYAIEKAVFTEQEAIIFSSEHKKARRKFPKSNVSFNDDLHRIFYT